MAQYLDLAGVQALWDRVKNWVRSYASLTVNNGVYTLNVGGNSTTLAPSDEKVQQVATTTSNNYAILFKNTTGVDGVTAGVRFGSKTNYLITANPGTGTITAKNFSGTATQATADGSGNTITSTYATKAEINGALVYRGSLPTYSSLPGSNGISVGYTYHIEDTKEEVFAKEIREDNNLYFNETTHNQHFTINIASDSTTPVINESDFRTYLSNKSQDKFSAYPILAYTYVDPAVRTTLSTGESNFHVVPVRSSTYGIMFVIVAYEHAKVTGGNKKAWAMTTRYDSPMNTWSGHIENMGEIIEITSSTPANENIRGFYAFGGGVVWEKLGPNVDDFSNKADKVVGATSGNFATLTADGNLADSGVSAAGSALTDTMVTQTATTTSASYPILFKESTATSTVTGTARFGSGVTINPSTKTVTATNFAGKANGLTLTQQSTGFTIAGGTTSRTLTVGTSYTLGAACAKGVASSFSASSTDLPTCAAVANYVSDQMTGTATFQSVISSNSTISGSAYKKGWYWIVGTAGTYVAVDCEAGDYIYAIADKVTSYNTSDFKVVQGNITPISATDIANLSND